MKLRQCQVCKCYLTDGEFNTSQYDRYPTCFLHRDKPKKQTASNDSSELSRDGVSNKRYIKVQATLKDSNVTIIEHLEVKDGEYDYQVFERWKKSLLVNCSFEYVPGERSR